MAINAEAVLDRSIGVSLLHVVYTVAQAAPLMGSEWDDSLATEVTLREESKHHLRVSSPPHRTANENG